MKKTLTILAASAALIAAIGFPAWSAMPAPADARLLPVAAFFEDALQSTPLVLASDDDGDHRWRETSRRDHDDHDSNGDDCDDEGDDDCRGATRNPAPVGTVAPPRNGLFENGAPPQVQVN